MYDPIFAKSFSRYEQKRFGFWAILVSMIMVVSICLEFKPNFHSLSVFGNAINLQPSSDAARDMLIKTKDMSISSPPLATELSQAFLIEQIDDPPPLAKAKGLEPIDIEIVEATGNPPLLNTEAKELRPPDLSTMQGTANQAKEVEPKCNLLGPLSDYCEMKGDIRIEAKSSTIFIVSSDPRMGNNPGKYSWNLQPYTRKGNLGAMISVKNWTVKLAGHLEENIPKCSLNHTTPSILFSTGGYSGNPFHDYSDLLIPIFSNSQQYRGEVIFLATDYKDWWISKYKRFFSNLSRHPIIPIDQENEIHCFSRMVLGLKTNKELDIDPSKFPNGSSMNHFRQFLRSTYSLERTKAIKLKRRGNKKLRLMLISRTKTRLITNEGEIIRMARKLGYEVIVAEARTSTNVTEFAQLVNSCDVLMGVHGAGLTNMVFLPDNAVLIQIIPWGGMDGFARVDFGLPSIDMNIQYLGYEIKVTESSLIQQYPIDHAVFHDPFLIHKEGWDAIKSTFLDKQNVRIDLCRFRPTLAKAIKLLRRH